MNSVATNVAEIVIKPIARRRRIRIVNLRGVMNFLGFCSKSCAVFARGWVGRGVLATGGVAGGSVNFCSLGMALNWSEPRLSFLKNGSSVFLFSFRGGKSVASVLGATGD